MPGMLARWMPIRGAEEMVGEEGFRGMQARGGGVEVTVCGSSGRTHSPLLRLGIDVGGVPSICGGRSMLRPYEVRKIDDASPSGPGSQKSRRDAGATKADHRRALGSGRVCRAAACCARTK